MPRVVVLKDFATNQECKELNSWVEQGIQEKWLDKGLSRGDSEYTKRVTSRMYGKRSFNPPIALDIQQRISNVFELNKYSKADLSGGNDGIVVSCTFKDGDVHSHIDPRSAAPLSTLRCNLLSSEAEEGCKLYVNNKHIEFNEGDLVCYLVTDWIHNVTENKTDKPRILWMFGWYLPYEEWETGQITNKTEST